MSRNDLPDTGENALLAERFEAHRGHLRAVAHRMLGSTAEADDAVQEAWLRLSRTDADRVANLGGWLTTVVGRVCLDMLRSRRSRAEDPLDTRPSSGPASGHDPEQDALIADSVGLALLVVLDALTPPERLAFVLHDLFGVPYDEVATILRRSQDAARQLASRARRRVQGSPPPDTDLVRQRRVVDAFRAAVQGGDFDALVRVLDPDVVARSGPGVTAGVTTGAAAVASGATTFAHLARVAHPAVIDGSAGLAVLVEGRLDRVLRFTFVHDRIAVVQIVSDPAALARLDVVPDA